MPVAYHINDIFYNYNPQENEDRIFYYPPHGDGNYYVPYAWIDGLIRGGYIYNSWWALTNPRTLIESPLAITLSGGYNGDTGEGNLDITIFAEDLITWQDLKLRIALTEDSIYYQAPNGTLWHNHTFRDMIPRTNGISISINQGETLEFSQNFSCSDPLVPKHCQLVVWVQADGSDREVLQAAKIKVSEMDIVGVDEVRELPRNFALSQNYPNPFNASTSITYSLDSKSEVELAIYDLTGRKIDQLVNGVQNAGAHEIIWNGTDSGGDDVASGIYFYRLSANGQNVTKRMVLIK